ncbi:MAG: twin-arginine translocase subunit TatC [Conexivisphaerales archaeon]
MVSMQDIETGLKELPFLSHLSELIKRLVRSLIVFFAFFAFFFVFKPSWINYAGLAIPYPVPSLFESFSTETFFAMKKYILPQQMLLINVNTFDTFLSVAYIAMALAAICSLPFWIYEASAFLGPALKPNEKRAVKLILVPATLLFVAGAFFSYSVVLPFLFRFLYYFSVSTGVEPTISVLTFVTISIAYTIALGLAFETPVIMVGLTYAGIVSYSTWLRYWRFAVLGAFIVALIISPGTTGGIMEITIGLMLSGLYFAGAIISRAVQRKKVRYEDLV